MRFNPGVAAHIQRTYKTVSRKRKRIICANASIAAAVLYQHLFHQFAEKRRAGKPIRYAASVRQLIKATRCLTEWNVRTAIDLLDFGNWIDVRRKRDGLGFVFRHGDKRPTIDPDDFYFSPAVAKKYGLVAAVLFYQMEKLAKMNAERDPTEHLICYNNGIKKTLRSFHSDHRYIPIIAIRRALKRLTEAGLLKREYIQEGEVAAHGGDAFAYSVQVSSVHDKTLIDNELDPGDQSPRDGEQSPRDRDQSPKDRVQSPRPCDQSPRAKTHFRSVLTGVSCTSSPHIDDNRDDIGDDNRDEVEMHSEVAKFATCAAMSRYRSITELRSAFRPGNMSRQERRRQKSRLSPEQQDEEHLYLERSDLPAKWDYRHPACVEVAFRAFHLMVFGENAKVSVRPDVKMFLLGCKECKCDMELFLYAILMGWEDMHPGKSLSEDWFYYPVAKLHVIPIVRNAGGNLESVFPEVHRMYMDLIDPVMA